VRDDPIDDDEGTFEEDLFAWLVEGVTDARFDAEVPPDCRVDGVAVALFDTEVPPDCRVDALFPL
jgi:hypothetical protein